MFERFLHQSIYLCYAHVVWYISNKIYASSAVLRNSQDLKSNFQVTEVRTEHLHLLSMVASIAWQPHPDIAQLISLACHHRAKFCCVIANASLLNLD